MKQKRISLCIAELQVKYGDKRALEIAAEIGCDAVDFATFSFSDWMLWDCRNPNSLFAKSDEEIIAYYTEIKQYADSLGLIIGQTHGRGKGFVGNKEEDDAEVANARIDLLAASVLGAKACVIHNPTSILLGANPDAELMRKMSTEQYTRMLPFAAQYGVKIATETFGDATGLNCLDFFGDADEFLAQFKRIQEASPYGEWLTMCMDTGHTNKSTRFGNPKVGDVIRMLGKDITVLHLNDNNAFADEHKIPMMGSIDWKDTFNALDEIGYDGVYNMEIALVRFGSDFMIEHAAFAVKALRHMLANR